MTQIKQLQHAQNYQDKKDLHKDKWAAFREGGEFHGRRFVAQRDPYQERRLSMRH